MSPNKKIFMAIPAVLILTAAVYQVFLKKEKSDFTVVEAKRGNIVREISETGQTRRGDKINLAFKNAGRIEIIYVKAGDKVERGQILAGLEASELRIQLQEAKANALASRAKLEKLLAGASQEEIQVSLAEVDNKKAALEIARQDLEGDYDSALNDLDDAYLKAYNAQNAADYVLRIYFNRVDQESVVVLSEKNKIEMAVGQIKSYIDSAKGDSSHENIDSALSQAKIKLSVIADSLSKIRENCETPAYRSAVSSTDKSSIDTHRANINTALTNIADAQQTIASDNLSISSAEASLQKAQDELSYLKSPARQEDVDLYKAEVLQAEAGAELLENKIREANLYSPIEGQIAEIKKRAGELVQPGSDSDVVVLLPFAQYDIKVDIYEEDIVQVNVGNPVDIILAAFPNQTLKGRVVSINPAEKMVDGVVYYEVIVAFDSSIENVKPGMTADIVIKTAFKENVLAIPEEALQKRDDKFFVEVSKNGKQEEREVGVGIEGQDGMTEIISGLQEGEKIIIR